MRFALATAIGLLFLAGPASAWAAGPTPGLVAAYSFDEGSGTVATDASGNAWTGAIVGASWAPGRYGSALSFDGTDDYVGLGGLGTFYQGGFTLEAWVQKQTGTKNDVAVLGSWTATESGGPMIWVDHLATRYQLVMNQGLSNYLDSGQNPVAGAWQHLAATFDGSAARFYIDGTEVANRTAASIGASNTWRIGAYGSPAGGFFDGLIDEVRVYNRALTAAEVQTDMNTPVSGLPPDTTPPSAPGTLTATGAVGQVSLSWSAAADDVGVARYDVYRSTTAGFIPDVSNRIAQPAGTSYTDAGLPAGTYYYRVAAEDAAGNVGPASNEAGAAATTDTAAPTAPGALAASAGAGAVGLSWSASTDDVAVARYNVHRGTSAGFAPTSANRIAQPVGTSYGDTGLAPGTYYYKVTAEDAAGNVGAASNEASATVADTAPPTAPSGLSATVGAGAVGLTWLASTDNVGVVRYDVHRGTTAGFAATSANRIAQPVGTSYTDTGLAPGTYYYKVTAEDAAGNVSGASNEVSATIDTTPPSVTITAPGGGTTVSNTVSVTASASDDVAVAGVQFKLDGQNLGPEDTSSPYSVTWDTRATPNGAHTLTAVARDGAGNSATSAAVAVSVSNAGVSPAGLRAAYRFDEGSGTIAIDTSGNHKTASVIGAGWTTGHFGSAVSLNGTSNEVDPPGLGTFYKTGFTYEAWVFKQSTKVDVGVVGSWVAGQGGGAMIWVDHVTGRYRLTLGTSFADYVDSGRSPAVGQWQHVAATYDGSVARFYVDGVQTASTTFTSSLGDSNTWRIGAYGSPAGGFFDGYVDNVRIYDRALSASEIETDMATPVPPDLTAPTVTTFTPGAGATGVNVGSSATVKFSEPMKATTITTSTLKLLDPTNTAVAATVTYDSSTNIATLRPQVALTFGGTYTITVKGGGGASDLSGNPLAADATSAFTTEASPPQILVVASTAKLFGMYVPEILRAEGMNAFTTLDVAFISPALLARFDVVVLGETALSPAQVTALTDWVTNGGNLVTLRPDKKLAGLLGISSASGTLSNGYVKVDTTTGPGAGIVGSTIQFHGTSDKYLLNGATTIADLYSNASTASGYPAVTLRSVGSNGGQAAAFVYDLARSVVYTRQGNPSWAGQERDGVSGLRPDDMFYSSWLNTSKIAIPQADEQQRLLVNLITVMERDRLPLPRFWYLPWGKKAAVAMSGDDHSPTQALGGTASNFDRMLALSPPGCVAGLWECVRATSYIYPDSVLTPAQAAAYAAQGFEVALHPVIGSCPTATMTQAALGAYFDAQLASWQARYADLPSPATNRTHCVYWPDWASAAKVELAHGMRMDGNYYHYPGSWIGSKPGFMTGGGFPMRFADVDGTPIDVYQAHTHMNDEATTSYSSYISALLDNAIGPLGYYGAFGINMHTDGPGAHPGVETIVLAAQARGVPVISYKQLLTWVDGRDSSTMRALSWNAGTFSFTTTVGAGASGLQTLLPTQGPSGTLSALSCGGSPTAYSLQTIKGIQYAMFDATTGTCQATYS